MNFEPTQQPPDFETGEPSATEATEDLQASHDDGVPERSSGSSVTTTFPDGTTIAVHGKHVAAVVNGQILDNRGKEIGSQLGDVRYLGDSAEQSGSATVGSRLKSLGRTAIHRLFGQK